VTDRPLQGGKAFRAATSALSLGAGASTDPAFKPLLPVVAGRNPYDLVDLQSRTVTYLRISVTDRCNYRCAYCMPVQGVEVVPRADLLSFDEIERLTRLFVSLGVRRVRLTGGEPLVRRGVVELVARLSAIPGVEDLAMTTNGHLLGELAGDLRRAGLQRLNVSIDTLDPKRFVELTRQGDVAAVLEGLQAAQSAGFRDIKLNMVVLRGINERDVLPLADYAAANGHILRCIEYMPVGIDAAWGPDKWFPAADVRALLAEHWELAPESGPPPVGGGPAVAWRGRRRSDGVEVRLGFISALSEKFCQTCNRVRLSSIGTLRECLSAPGTLSLRDRIRAGQDDADIQAAIRGALTGKVDAHRFEVAVATPESMSAIGG
jgi:cyclic pyranopterin phosphate synthase